ncbi:hypothetical protein C9374_004304 [Naegleria lovaniensis]|uniref:VPS9 domain-containing protein n=1 Tax=Naegleria lovaniensis TaxID=51637 RepID=A0AA88GSG1_NAELO|nr:uncharacterized protein C9374_004304 [Naegleria lovaniensis]KAG2383633.1 hypothetical protein C9374_004304 [Naegleria lovaniensis]
MSVLLPSSSSSVDQLIKQVYSQVHYALNYEEKMNSSNTSSDQLYEALANYGKAIQLIGSMLQSKDVLNGLFNSNYVDRLKMIYEKCSERTILLLQQQNNRMNTITSDSTTTTTTTSSSSNPTTLSSSPKMKPFYDWINNARSMVLGADNSSSLNTQQQSSEGITATNQVPIERLNEQFNLTKAKLMKLDAEQNELMKRINDHSQQQSGENYLKMKRKFQEKARMKEQTEKELIDIDQQRAHFYNKELELANTLHRKVDVIENYIENNMYDSSGGMNNDVESFTDVGPNALLESKGYDAMWLQFIHDNFHASSLSQEAQDYEHKWLNQLNIINQSQDLYYFILGYVMNVQDHPISILIEKFAHKFKLDFSFSEETPTITADFAVLYVKEFCANFATYLVDSFWKHSLVLSKNRNFLYSAICQTTIIKIEKEIMALYLNKHEAKLIQERLTQFRTISLLDLGTDPQLCCENLYQPIINRLREISKTQLLSEKIKLAKEVFSSVVDIATKHTSIQYQEFEHKLLPVFIYIIVKANIPTIFAIFDFMIDFSHNASNSTIFPFDGTYWDAISTLKSAMLQLLTLLPNPSSGHTTASVNTEHYTLDSDIEQEFEMLSHDKPRTSLEKHSDIDTTPKTNLLDRYKKLMKK